MHAGAARPAQARDRGPGSAAADADRLVSLLTPVVAGHGMDLDGLRVIGAGRRRLLRVVVDADGGVSLDDIAVVSRELSAALDAAGAMGEAPYTLEVSSPGVDRPLTQPRHWRRNIGRLVTVTLSGGSSGEVIEGRIIDAAARGVTIDVAGRRGDYGYEELGPGKVLIEFGRLSEAGNDGGEGDEGAAEEEPDGH
jgi:ribosome maturation factor RimP